MSIPRRKSGFFDIGNGKFGLELQDAYEEAARKAYESNQAITVTANITVAPPDNRDNIGAVSFTLKVSSPTRKSIKYEAQYSGDGKIIATAPMDIGVLQESLYFDDNTVVEEPIAFNERV